MNSTKIKRIYYRRLAIAFFMTAMQLSTISVRSQELPSVYIENLSSIKGCDIPEYLDSTHNSKDHNSAFQKDSRLIQMINVFDSLEYKDLKQKTRHFTKIYSYVSKYPTDSVPKILTVATIELYNKGFCTLLIKLYLDDTGNILYRYLNLEVDKKKCDFSYVKLLLTAINVKIKFTTCFSADLNYGESKIAKFTCTTGKAAGL